MSRNVCLSESLHGFILEFNIFGILQQASEPFTAVKTAKIQNKLFVFFFIFTVCLTDLK